MATKDFMGEYTTHTGYPITIINTKKMLEKDEFLFIPEKQLSQKVKKDERNGKEWTEYGYSGLVDNGTDSGAVAIVNTFSTHLFEAFKANENSKVTVQRVKNTKGQLTYQTIVDGGDKRFNNKRIFNQEQKTPLISLEQDFVNQVLDAEKERVCDGQGSIALKELYEENEGESVISQFGISRERLDVLNKEYLHLPQ